MKPRTSQMIAARDIKPGDVYVSEEGHTALVKSVEYANQESGDAAFVSGPDGVKCAIRVTFTDKPPIELYPSKVVHVVIPAFRTPSI